MSIAQLYDCRARLEAVVQAKLCIGTEVLDTRNVSATWLDDWKICLSKKEEVESICKQHLMTKAIRQYKNAMVDDKVLKDKINKRKTKVVLGEVTYLVSLEDKNGVKIDVKKKEEALILAMFKQSVDELEAVANFVKKTYGNDPVAKSFLTKKRTIHTLLIKARDKVINQV